MKEYEQAERDHSFNMQTVLQLIRAAGPVLGIIVMIIGIVYVTRIFSMVSAALQNPEAFASLRSVRLPVRATQHPAHL